MVKTKGEVLCTSYRCKPSLVLVYNYMSWVIAVRCCFVVDDSVKYVTIIPVGSQVPEADMYALVSQMQSSCEQSSKFLYRTILAPEAEQLLCSITKPVVPSKPATAAASTVVCCAPPVTTTVPLSAARLLVTKQPGSIMLPALGSQVKIIVGSVDMLRSLNTCMQVEGRDEEEEMADRSRSPSPPHPIFNGPVVRYEVLLLLYSFLSVR